MTGAVQQLRRPNGTDDHRQNKQRHHPPRRKGPMHDVGVHTGHDTPSSQGHAHPRLVVAGDLHPSACGVSCTQDHTAGHLSQRPSCRHPCKDGPPRHGHGARPERHNQSRPNPKQPQSAIEDHAHGLGRLRSVPGGEVAWPGPGPLQPLGLSSKSGKQQPKAHEHAHRQDQRRLIGSAPGRQDIAVSHAGKVAHSIGILHSRPLLFAHLSSLQTSYFRVVTAKPQVNCALSSTNPKTPWL